MAGKKKVEKDGNSWVSEIEKYSRQIWLAGLGAYSKISKDGEKLFDALVADGQKAEKLVKTGVDKQVDAVKSSTKSARSKVEEASGTNSRKPSTSASTMPSRAWACPAVSRSRNSTPRSRH